MTSQIPSTALVIHPGRILPGAEIIEGELVEPAPYQAAEPEFCDECGHFHRPGSVEHPALLHQPCGSYLCCH